MLDVGTDTGTAEAIRVARERAGLRQIDVASKAHLSLTTIGLAEKGLATARTIERIAKVLRVTADDLHGEARHE